MNIHWQENQLKKIVPYIKKWGRMQNDLWDKETLFIYNSNKFDDIYNHIKSLHKDPEFEQYAYHRWYNFWSAKSIEYIFSQSSKVKTNKDIYHKKIDFYINNIPFDHKTSVYPKGFEHPIESAISNPQNLIYWLYQNQSKQQRFHLSNRLFVILYNNNGQHYSLRSELIFIANKISRYLDSFDENKLIEVNFEASSKALSDVIWCVQ